jgi:hypothetical protein
MHLCSISKVVMLHHELMGISTAEYKRLLLNHDQQNALAVVLYYTYILFVRGIAFNRLISMRVVIIYY